MNDDPIRVIPWTAQEEEILHKHIDESADKLHKRLPGRSREACRIHRDRLRRNEAEPFEPKIVELPVEEEEPEESIEDLKAHNAELLKSNRNLYRQFQRSKHKTADLVQAVYDACRDAYLLEPYRPIPQSKPRKERTDRREEVALQHWTDWHIGERTISYDIEVGKARIMHALQSIENLVEIGRADHPVNKGVVLFGGDMLTGVRIFPGQAYGIDATILGQLFPSINLMRSVIEWNLRLFDEVKLVSQRGNHTRMGEKGDWLVPESDNWDRVAVEVLRQYVFPNENRITWQMDDDFYERFTIGNYKAILVHGQQARAFGGNLPSYRIMKMVTAWASGVLEPFQDCYIGHFHQEMELTLPNGNKIYLTASPTTDDENATENCAAKSGPSQRLHFVDPVRGRITSRHQLYLDGVTSASDIRPAIKTADDFMMAA
jgi:hypothetical protein